MARIYVDANAVIVAVEGTGEVAEATRSLLAMAGSIESGLITSEITLSEVLVRPIRDNDPDLARAYRSLLAGPAVSAVPVSRQILLVAAELRATHRALKLADAIHLATAVDAACDCLLSNDARMPALPGVRVVRLRAADLRQLAGQLA